MKYYMPGGQIKASILVLLSLTIVFILAACSYVPAPLDRLTGDSQKVRVVATTTILGDVVGQVGGEAIDLQVLLPFGADPHTFEPTPQDLVIVSRAKVIFINGVGLEEFLDQLLESASEDAEVIEVSAGIVVREMEEDHEDGEDHEDEDDTDHPHEEGDPHVWTDPNNVILWTENIERALSRLDPANAATYAAKAANYRAELEQLDAWILTQLDQIPAERRRLVTDHKTLGYFADHYGFEQSGALIPGFSSGASPSAQELAALLETIKQLEIQAVFVGTTVNPIIAQRLAEDAGIQLVTLYTDSLTDPQGEASTYLDLMRYNVSAIVSALKE